MKKRLLAMLMIAALVFSLVGCANSYEDIIYSEYIPDENAVVNTDNATEDNDGQEQTEVDSKTGKIVKKSTGSKSSKNTGSTSDNSKNSKSKGNALDDDLDLGGKTITKTIIGTISPEIQRRAAAFEEKYNCKMKFIKLKWDNYNSSVASSIAAGTPYDICGLAPHFYPEAVVSNLYEPYDDCFTDADVYGNPKNTKGGGLDLTLMETYKLNGHYYGGATHTGAFSSSPIVLLYNKKMLKAAGYTGKKDPLEMYKANNWTWDTFEEMANNIQKNKNLPDGTYVLGGEIYPSRQYIVYSNGVSLTKVSNGKVVQNLEDKKFLNALTRINKWFTASKPFIDVKKGYSDSLPGFIKGTYYMQVGSVSTGPIYVMPQIKDDKTVFGGISGLGVVPFPIGPDNKSKALASAGVYAKATAKGGDKIAALAWVKWCEYFEDPMGKDDPYQYSDELQKEIDKWYDNLILPVANYKSSGSATAEGLLDGILSDASTSDNYAQSIKNNTSLFQNCIDTALKQK